LEIVGTEPRREGELAAVEALLAASAGVFIAE
jgi:hypothetical protein